MDVQGGWFGFQKVLTQKGGKVWSGLGLFLVGHTVMGGGLGRFKSDGRLTE